MKFCGLQKTTLLDYPGHVAATVFTGGCNFRCPFCHNSDLIQPKVLMLEDEILTFLRKRSRILEGVCITGGEPTLQSGLKEFIMAVKDMGLEVKLDTNGYRPDVLAELCSERLVDYVAMDIKSSRENYAKACGLVHLDLDKIEESVELLKAGDTAYEFRTTVVKGLHEKEDFPAIGKWLEGCSAYYLQAFKDSEQVPNHYFETPSKLEMQLYAKYVKPYVPHVKLRGID